MPNFASSEDSHSHRSDVTSVHLRRAQNGDTTSLNWVIGRFSPLLLAHVRFRVGRNAQTIADPEDLAQEVWMLVMPNLKKLKPREGHLTPVLLRYMTSVSLNLYRNALRRHAVRRGQSTGTAGGLNGFGGAAAAAKGFNTGMTDGGSNDPSCPNRRPLSWVAHREHADKLMEAIEQLSPEDREVVVLRGIEQVSNKATAQALGEPENNVAKRFQRAIAKLRRLVPGSIFDELK